MRKRFRIRQAVLLMLVSCTMLKFACQAAVLPSALLGAGVLSVVALLSIVCSVLVRWLGGSFGFFSVGLCGCKKYKCATKCVGYANSKFILSI